MTTHFVSSREFTRDVAGAKRAAEEGPVFVTNRGEPEFVVLSIKDFKRMKEVPPQNQSLFDVMQALQPLPADVGDIERTEIQFRDIEL